jgi:hypothetical protein
VTLVDGDGIYVWGVQLEQGQVVNGTPVDAPTPSSYIPTSGSTVIRGGQSLTVPANWYDVDNPTNTGSPELLSSWVNGSTYAYDTFTSSGSSITSAITDGSNFAGAASNEIVVTSGEQYIVSFDLTLNSGSAPQVYFVNSQNGGAAAVSNQETSVSGANTIILTPTTSGTGYLQIRHQNGVSGDYSTGAVSVRQPVPQFGWPEPEFIGPELVADFSTYADQAAFDVDWTRGSGWTFDANNDTAIHAAGSATLLTQSISMTLGRVYQATCDVVACSGGTGSLQFRGGGTTTVATIDVTDVGSSVQVTYVADGNTQVGVNAGAGTDLTVNNISVREINPLSVSIQMDGRMTYADDDTDFTTVAFANWEVDTSNYIRPKLDTYDVNTGRYYAFSRTNGVNYSDGSEATQYQPGVLVPFNIAGRWTSTEVEAGQDGIASGSPSTTVTELLDLSNTDLEIAQDFMGTIGQFRQFAGDIGDAGLVTATNPSTEPTLSLTFDGTGGSFYNLNWSE